MCIKSSEWGWEYELIHTINTMTTSLEAKQTIITLLECVGDNSATTEELAATISTTISTTNGTTETLSEVMKINSGKRKIYAEGLDKRRKRFVLAIEI